MSLEPLVGAIFALTGMAFFVGGTHFWLDARNQRRRALAELRVARRLRSHADRSWEAYVTVSEEALRIHSGLADAWHRMYGTPFPVPPPESRSTTQLKG